MIVKADLGELPEGYWIDWSPGHNGKPGSFSFERKKFKTKLNTYEIVHHGNAYSFKEALEECKKWFRENTHEETIRGRTGTDNTLR